MAAEVQCTTIRAHKADQQLMGLNLTCVDQPSQTKAQEVNLNVWHTVKVPAVQLQLLPVQSGPHRSCWWCSCQNPAVVHTLQAGSCQCVHQGEVRWW